VRSHMQSSAVYFVSTTAGKKREFFVAVSANEKHTSVGVGASSAKGSGCQQSHKAVIYHRGHSIEAQGGYRPSRARARCLTT